MASVCVGKTFSAMRCFLRPTQVVASCRFVSQQRVMAGKKLRQIQRMRRNVEKWKNEREDRDMKLKMYSFEIESLATRGFLRSTKAYSPPPDVESRLDQIALETFSKSAVDGDLHAVSLKDPVLKYKFLVKCIKDFEHDIPSSQLHKMKTVGDVCAYFKLPVKTTTSYDDLPKMTNLPPNLHVQAEPYRFNPETDSLFGGVSAYPGRSTIVTGLKAKRLFKGYTVPAIIPKLKVN